MKRRSFLAALSALAALPRLERLFVITKYDTATRSVTFAELNAELKRVYNTEVLFRVVEKEAPFHRILREQAELNDTMLRLSGASIITDIREPWA